VHCCISTLRPAKTENMSVAGTREAILTAAAVCCSNFGSPDEACVIREQTLKQPHIFPDSARQLLLHRLKRLLLVLYHLHIPAGVRSLRATIVHLFMDRQ
jgi:hypothetical protein